MDFCIYQKNASWTTIKNCIFYAIGDCDTEGMRGSGCIYFTGYKRPSLGCSKNNTLESNVIFTRYKLYSVNMSYQFNCCVRENYLMGGGLIFNAVKNFLVTHNTINQSFSNGIKGDFPMNDVQIDNNIIKRSRLSSICIKNHLDCDYEEQNTHFTGHCPDAQNIEIINNFIYCCCYIGIELNDVDHLVIRD